MALKVFSQRITDSRPQVALRGSGNNLCVNKAVARRFLIEVETVKISVLLIDNREGRRRRAGCRDRREGKNRKGAFFSRSLRCIQRLAASHAKNHIRTAFFYVCSNFFHPGIGTVLSKQDCIHDRDRIFPFCKRLQKLFLSCLQCQFSTDQQRFSTVLAAHFIYIFICFFSDCIIRKIYRISHLTATPLISSNVPVPRRSSSPPVQNADGSDCLHFPGKSWNPERLPRRYF